MLIPFWLYLSYLLSLLVLLAFLYKWFAATHKSYRLPPSPPKLPIIGNLHQLGSSTHRSLHALAKNYGPLMLLHLGSVPMIVASSGEVAREIMKTNDLVFSTRPNTTMPRKLFYKFKDIAFAPYGEQWRQMKTMVVLHLLSNKKVQSFQQVREEEVALMIENITNLITCSPSSSLVNLSDILLSLTNNVLCRLALGRKYGGLINFKHLLEELLYLMGIFRVGDFIPWLSWLDCVTGLNSRVEKNAKEMDEFLEGVIEDHLADHRRREACGGGSKEDERQDFVDILLQIQKENTMRFPIDRDTIKGVILNMFAAGTDTVFTALGWIMAELLRHPHFIEKVQNEVREIVPHGSKITEDNLGKLDYLKATIKEALRLHPPVPLLIPHESTQEAKIMGYDVAAGTHVYTNVWAIGRDPLVWEDPNEFNPERFLDCSIDYKGFHFEFIPFGAGRRGCPAIKFATSIIELALANMLHKFDLALPARTKLEDFDMSETSGITVQMKSPLMVVAIPR